MAGARHDFTVGLLAGAAVLAIAVIPLTIWIIKQNRQHSASYVCRRCCSSGAANSSGAIACRNHSPTLAPALAQRIARPLGVRRLRVVDRVRRAGPFRFNTGDCVFDR